MPTRLTEARVAQRLHEQGYSLEVIATVLDKPMSALSITRTELSPEDRHLAEGLRALAWKMIGQATWIMDNGAPDQQLSLLRAFLPKLAPLIGQETSSQTVEAKAALERLWASQRQVQTKAEIRQLSVPTDSHAAPASIKPPEAVAGGKRPARQPQPEVDDD